MQEGPEPELFWESTYAIVIALMTHFPDRDPTKVGINELAEMIELLPNFSDDPAMVTERILMDIQIVWYEEASNL
ncbi:MAG: Fe-S cluster assembly protein IscX [Chloroflexota bacterium]